MLHITYVVGVLYISVYTHYIQNEYYFPNDLMYFVTSNKSLSCAENKIKKKQKQKTCLIKILH